MMFVLMRRPVRSLTRMMIPPHCIHLRTLLMLRQHLLGPWPLARLLQLLKRCLRRLQLQGARLEEQEWGAGGEAAIGSWLLTGLVV